MWTSHKYLVIELGETQIVDLEVGGKNEIPLIVEVVKVGQT